jgi:C-terminal processing protease CtpA/Prc
MELFRESDTVDVKITLDDFYMPTVKTSYVDSVPVIRITEFSAVSVSDSGTYGEFMTALEKTKGAKSTILDLRGNPGGDGDQCYAIAMEMLSKGDTVSINYEADYDSVWKGEKWDYYQVFDTLVYKAPTDGVGNKRYYVLMADTVSASCAELVLAALTANKKSPIVGMLSYGKGIGQMYLSSEAGIMGLAMITAFKVRDKNRKSYHDLGFVPDYEISDPQKQMAKAVELAKKRSAVRTAGYGTTRLGHFSKKSASEKQETLPSLNDMKVMVRKYTGPKFNGK